MSIQTGRTPREPRILTWLLGLWDNPVYRLELRYPGLGFYSAGTRSSGRGPTPGRQVCAALCWTPPMALLAYALDPIFRWFTGLMALGATGGGPNRDSSSVFMVVLLGLLVGAGLLQVAAVRIAAERTRGTLDAVLITRLTASEIVLGKTAAVYVPYALGISGLFAIWLACPPFASHARFEQFVVTQPPRVLIGLLWGDALMLGLLCAFAGSTLSAWSRQVRDATLASMVLSTAPCAVAIFGIHGVALAPLLQNTAWQFLLWLACAVISALLLPLACGPLTPSPAHRRR